MQSSLKKGLGRKVDDMLLAANTPGVIHKDLLILGHRASESTGAVPGHIRAFDVISGKIEWTFHTIPYPGEFGYDTWPEDSYLRSGGANAWAGLSLDEKNEIVYDIKMSIQIFKKNLNIEPDIFSYPFGEYDVDLMKIVENFGFKYAFGQHSGVINFSSNNYELPRFPINEKYGDIDRFKSVINFLPFPYEKIIPENKYLTANQNPPDVKITFFKNLINIKNMSCYSNEEDKWEKSNINFINDNEISIKLRGKFTTERGRINCSLMDKNGKWRWLGIQYVLEEN